MPFSDQIPRTHSFSLGDFHDFDSCVFRFFVNHHLRKKYELAEGSESQAIGSLLDLAMKKLHLIRGYGQPLDYLATLVKAAEVQIREEVLSRGEDSFYGKLPPFLTAKTITKAQAVFKNYCVIMKGKFKKIVPTKIMQKPKPFWERIIQSGEPLRLWGGPDAIEEGEDGVPEVVDYKYFEDQEKGKNYLDMDLMPKLYILLAAEDLKNSGFKKSRFVTRLWSEPGNNSFYEEFDLETAQDLENFFKDKMERILRTEELTFCEKDYCKVCKSPQREAWIKELQKRGWIKN